MHFFTRTFIILSEREGDNMKIESKLKKDILEVKLEGRLDLDSASELEKFLKENSEGIKGAVFDFKKLDYVSSAGLRVLLWLRKKGPDENFVVIKHMNATVKSIFELTGFYDMFCIKG